MNGQVAEPEASPVVDPIAERTVLAAVLLDNAVLPAVEAQLRVEHLHSAQHRTIYTAMLSMGHAGRDIDIITLRDELGSSGLEAAGGLGYLGGLIDGLPRRQNVDAWARIVREKARRRAAIGQAQRLIEQAMDHDVETDELLDRAHAGLARLMESGDRRIVQLRDVLPAALSDLDAFAVAQDGVTGIPTGLVDLDRTIGGLTAGRLYIVAARTSRGKSVLCAQAAVNAAACGKRVLVFSMEMEPYQLAQRMLLADAEVDRWHLKPESGKREYALAKVNRSFGRLMDLPVWFDQRESPNLAQIRASARQQQSSDGLDLVVVDYLQRASVDPKIDRWLAVGDLAKGLKSLARNLSVPVVAACQLNADAEERRPTMAMLGQAQSIISAEADCVIMLHPEDLQRWKTQDYPIVNFFVDKNRTGPCVAIQVSFEKACSRFVSMARKPETAA